MSNDASIYSKELIEKAQERKHFGRMNDPTCSAYTMGICGDEMEFYLIITDGIIEDVRYFTEGCISTLLCGSIAAELVSGKSIYDALRVSPHCVLEQLKGLPPEGTHCSILAVTTLHKAIADYLLKP
ncbi:iron-sulfur cluster assembly scaffold protein [Desulfosarcina sp.]|nr:iron-sulfur cluster assembly scaffold protein [Desulfosarcina sp.]